MSGSERPPEAPAPLSKSAIAKGYDAVADGIGMNPALYRRCFRLAGPIGRASRVLDLGCGPGGLIATLLEDHEVAAVGCDLSRELCSRTRQRNGVPVVQGDAERLPFASTSFDLVFMTEVMEHLQDPQAALAEVRRLLVSGGRFVLSVPNRDWPRYLTYEARHQQFQPVDDHWFRVEEMRTLLETNGWRVEVVGGWGSLHGGGFLKESWAAILYLLAPSTRAKRKRMIVCAVPAGGD